MELIIIKHCEKLAIKILDENEEFNESKLHDALIIAIILELSETIERLIDKGANVNQVTKRGTALDT